MITSENENIRLISLNDDCAFGRPEIWHNDEWRSLSLCESNYFNSLDLSSICGQVGFFGGNSWTTVFSEIQNNSTLPDNPSDNNIIYLAGTTSCLFQADYCRCGVFSSNLKDTCSLKPPLTDIHRYDLIVDCFTTFSDSRPCVFTNDPYSIDFDSNDTNCEGYNLDIDIDIPDNTNKHISAAIIAVIVISVCCFVVIICGIGFCICGGAAAGGYVCWKSTTSSSSSSSSRQQAVAVQQLVHEGNAATAMVVTDP